MEHISEMFFYVIDAFLFVFGVALCLRFTSVNTDMIEHTNDDIKQKTSVFEIDNDIYSNTETIISASDVCNEIISCSEHLEYVIDSHTITDDEWNEIIKDGNIATLYSLIDTSKAYKKNMEFDDEGNVTKVQYKKIMEAAANAREI